MACNCWSLGEELRRNPRGGELHAHTAPKTSRRTRYRRLSGTCFSFRPELLCRRERHSDTRRTRSPAVLARARTPDRDAVEERKRPLGVTVRPGICSFDVVEDLHDTPPAPSIPVVFQARRASRRPIPPEAVSQSAGQARAGLLRPDYTTGHRQVVFDVIETQAWGPSFKSLASAIMRRTVGPYASTSAMTDPARAAMNRR